MTLAVAHTSHGFDSNDIGKAVRSSGTDGQFIIARANTAVNSEVVGIITSIEGVNNYTITTSGFVDIVAAVPTATAGTVFFLAEADDSQLTSTEPTTLSAVSKPVAVITESNAKMLLIHYRGEVIASSVTNTAPNDAQYVTLATSTGLGAERVLTAGSGITLTDAGANGAATISIANDSINSEHYAATSIDNEHLADDAVGIAELSATGTASSSTFLRGDNAWAAPASGPSQAAQSAIEAETNEDTYLPPDLIKHSPGVAKAWCQIASAGTLVSGDYGVASITDVGTGQRTIVFDTDFSSTNFVALGKPNGLLNDADEFNIDSTAVGSASAVHYVSGSLTDRADFATFFGDQ
jgi:hypothetical protein